MSVRLDHANLCVRDVEAIGSVVDAYWRDGLAACPDGDFTEIFKLIGAKKN